MVPLQLYISTPGSLRKSQWGFIDPSILSPWNVMSWGMKQIRGFVVGSDSLESAPRLRPLELVLVENLQVRDEPSTQTEVYHLERILILFAGDCETSGEAGYEPDLVQDGSCML